MSATGKRFAYTGWLLARVDRPVLWAAKGDYFVDPRGQIKRLPPDTAYDCSGLCMAGIRSVVGPDHRATWNAQKMADSFPPTTAPEPGDFGFYGRDWRHVIHVVVYLAGGHVLSADGASHRILTLADAKKANARVRLHETVDYRHDVPFLGWRRNTFIAGPEEEPPLVA